MAKAGNSLSRTAVWILMGLLILGLGGFGIDGVLNASANRVARVGDKDVDVQTYARALQNALNAEAAARGSAMDMATARAIGLPDAVIASLVRDRALDSEAAELGISVGDENLRDQILSIAAFQGVDGSFDRDGYRFALENAGLSENAFEQQLRDETARTILQGSILSGVSMPAAYADTLVNFVGETRDFTWSRLQSDDLEDALAAPDTATLEAFHSENIADYQLPATKRISYAVLLPVDLIDTIDIPADDLRAAYEQRADVYNQPERRLVERLVFLDDAAAEQAAAQLDVGTTFESLVETRGLTLDDIDLGDVDRLSLDAAGEAVFAANVGDVVGPLPSPLGPALFRVNGILPAQSTSFEDAEPELRDILAADRAGRLIETLAQDYDDILAGGATLEELANETEMQLGTIDWFPASGEGIAAYNDFRDRAAELADGDFPQIFTLEDGGIFAMRLDDELPERPAPFADVADSVRGNWEARRAERLLMERAGELIPQLETGTTFAALELDSVEEAGLDRGAFVSGTPPTFMATIFEMEPGDVRAMESFGSVLVVRLDAIRPASENPDAEALRAQLRPQMDQALARDLFAIFASDTVLRAAPEIDRAAMEAVHANFP